MISGLDAVAGGVVVTHAGTARDADGQLVTAGGRVLSVTALGDDAAAARAGAYAAAEMIEFDGRQLRRDIALQRADERRRAGPGLVPVDRARAAAAPTPRPSPSRLMAAEPRRDRRSSTSTAAGRRS